MGELAACFNLDGVAGRIQHLGGNQTELARKVKPQCDFFGHAATFNVDCVCDEFASQSLQHRICNVGTCAVLSFHSGGSEVRSNDNLRQSKQRRISAGLACVDVKARTTDVAGGDSVCQSLLVNQAAACCVDDDLTLLGLRQEVLVKHACGFFGLRQVNGHKVRTTHQLF